MLSSLVLKHPTGRLQRLKSHESRGSQNHIGYRCISSARRAGSSCRGRLYVYLIRIGLVFRGGHNELEQMDSASPPLAVHCLYVDGYRKLHRSSKGSWHASSVGDLLAAAPPRLAPVHRSVLVRAAIRHQVAQRTTH